jgi:hypothetical protein
MTMRNKLQQQHCNVYIPKNLTPWGDSNPGSSEGERDGHYTTPPGDSINLRRSLQTKLKVVKCRSLNMIFYGLKMT